MKKTMPVGLLIVLLIGTLFAACGPIFDIEGDFNGGNNAGGGNPNPPSTPPSSKFKAVIAYDWMDLLDYLQSDDTSYAITLETEDNDLYIKKSISIVKPMRVIGRPGVFHTIHTVGSENGNTFFSIDLQADMDLDDCSLTGYFRTSGASLPFTIRDDVTLTITGEDSVLELRGACNANAIRPGSQVILSHGASIVDESGDLLFRSGVEKVTISGIVPLYSKLIVGEGATLQIEGGGVLRVEPGATLRLDEKIKELKLGGNIIIDRTKNPGANFLAADLAGGTLFEKITGGGYLVIENGVVGENPPFRYGANTNIKLDVDGITLGKLYRAEVGGVIHTTDDITIPKGKKLLVDEGMDLFVEGVELILKGGALNAAGNVNVTKSGKIIIMEEDKFTATPNGSVAIKSGANITVDGTFHNRSVTWDEEKFTSPLYGTGSLIIKDKGKVLMGEDNKKIIGNDTSYLLQLTETNSSITIKNTNVTPVIPEFTLKGGATLTVPSSGSALEGRFIIAAGAAMTVGGGGTLTVKAPNQLTGTVTNPPAAQLILKGSSTKVEIFDSTSSTTPVNELVDVFEYDWSLSGTSAAWSPFLP